MSPCALSSVWLHVAVLHLDHWSLSHRLWSSGAGDLKALRLAALIACLLSSHSLTAAVQIRALLAAMVCHSAALFQKYLPLPVQMLGLSLARRAQVVCLFVVG
tara:strand:- start:4874 stop:5182 length:309 start_codon:yes stop_codon:yes gene_type:complete